MRLIIDPFLSVVVVATSTLGGFEGWGEMIDLPTDGCEVGIPEGLCDGSSDGE